MKYLKKKELLICKIEKFFIKYFLDKSRFKYVGIEIMNVF